MATAFDKKLIDFYLQLQPPAKLPKGFEILYPQQDEAVKKIVTQFYKKYYANKIPKRMMLGINPGRLGAGITGINFTAPKQLKEQCGIVHPFKISSELSAEFIYEVIDGYGGMTAFCNDWFIGAVCPLGFIKEGKNINYYDDKKLMAAVTAYIVQHIAQQLSFGFKTDYCICVGGEKNYKFLQGLNEQYQWFENILPLPHPRFILQYRRKQKQQYIDQYLVALQKDKI